MSNLTLQQAQMLDEILKFYIEQKKSNEKISLKYDFSRDDIVDRFKINIELAGFLVYELSETLFQNFLIVSYYTPREGAIQYYRFDTNENTCKFIDNGGFTKIVEDQEKERLKQKQKEDLEFQNLRLGPKQFRFNKTSVWINAILTLITIVLTVLIALGIIDK